MFFKRAWWFNMLIFLYRSQIDDNFLIHIYKNTLSGPKSKENVLERYLKWDCWFKDTVTWCLYI